MVQSLTHNRPKQKHILFRQYQPIWLRAHFLRQQGNPKSRKQNKCYMRIAEQIEARTMPRHLPPLQRISQGIRRNGFDRPPELKKTPAPKSAGHRVRRRPQQSSRSAALNLRAARPQEHFIARSL
jgi:hypothetical protein